MNGKSDEWEEMKSEFEVWWKSLPPTEMKKVRLYRKVWKIFKAILDTLDSLF